MIQLKTFKRRNKHLTNKEITEECERLMWEKKYFKKVNVYDGLVEGIAVDSKFSVAVFTIKWLYKDVYHMVEPIELLYYLTYDEMLKPVFSTIYNVKTAQCFVWYADNRFYKRSTQNKNFIKKYIGREFV